MRGPAGHARSPASPADHRHASRTLPASDVTSISPSKPSRDTSSKSIPGAHFTTRSRLAVDVQQRVERRACSRADRTGAARRCAGPGRRATTVSRVTGRSASARQSVDVGDVVAAPSPAGPGRCRCRRRRRPSRAVPQARCRSNRSTSCTAAPASRRARCAATGAAVACCSASSVNSQSDGSANLAAALRRSSVVSTSTAARSPNRVTRRGDVGDQCGVGQPKLVDLARAPRARVATADRRRRRGANASQDGLTPVTMTL